LPPEVFVHQNSISVMESSEDNKVENLSGPKAVEKLQELVKGAQVCMFMTQLQQLPLSCRPMSPVDTDDQGYLWFFSDKNSDKNAHIVINPDVQLCFTNMSASEFLSIHGRAEVITDREKFKEKWSPAVAIWFKDGVDDPNLSLIKVTPLHVHYWDTKHGKVAAMLKMAASLVTGHTMDDGVEGKLQVN
jgi:general stress protein 26